MVTNPQNADRINGFVSVHMRACVHRFSYSAIFFVFSFRPQKRMYCINSVVCLSVCLSVCVLVTQVCPVKIAVYGCLLGPSGVSIFFDIGVQNISERDVRADPGFWNGRAQVERWRRDREGDEAPRRVGFERGVFLHNWGEVWGGGIVPSLEMLTVNYVPWNGALLWWFMHTNSSS